MADIDFMATSRLFKAFTPTSPISLPDLLSGREDTLLRLQFDVLTPSQHVLLYGDRGVGKTSIARVLAVAVQEADIESGTRSIVVSCDTEDTFGSIWRKAFQEILLAERRLGFAQRGVRNIIGRFDPAGPLDSPNDLRLLIDSLPNPSVVVIDEFDRARDPQVRALMADTIKLFSDNETRCTIVPVGVGGSIEGLIASHESISRNVDYVLVELMAAHELAGIIERGFASAGLGFEPGLDFRIARMSQGYPHYTHLLGLWSGVRALRRGGDRVVGEDLDMAIPDSIQNAAGGIRLEYDRATDSTQPNNLFKEVLLACAMANKDVRGRFSLSAVREPLQKILGRPIKQVSYQRHLAAFCEPDRGPVLIRTGRRRNYRWQFANPQLVPFVRLQGINDGFIASA